jgi:hypothetical protein
MKMDAARIVAQRTQAVRKMYHFTDPRSIQRLYAMHVFGQVVYLKAVMNNN